MSVMRLTGRRLQQRARDEHHTVWQSVYSVWVEVCKLFLNMLNFNSETYAVLCLVILYLESKLTDRLPELRSLVLFVCVKICYLPTQQALPW